ncbi:hypothetical protein [Aeromonas veronii]|uniref:hypothetical protein n=1 Tax=Aeromonas veronii TaxID=654 RepID=UPI002B47688D|nr:hypothetical protein [Aeromonas veronii]
MMGQLIAEKDIGDYCKVKVVSNSNLCVICFSGFNTPKGKFNYIRSFSHNDYHQIYLNTTAEEYYHQGIHGLGDGLEETIHHINEILQELPGENIQVITLGCSMGGYGALLYGTLLNANKVIALGPSLPLYSESFLGRSERLKHVDIYLRYERRIIDSEVQKIIVHGDSIISDILTHEKLKHARNSVCKHLRGCSHSQAEILKGKLNLSDFIENTSIALEHIENIYPSFDFPQDQYKLLQRMFAPENLDGICRDSLKIANIAGLHHTVLYCIAVSNILTDQELAKKCFSLALEKHLHYRSAKRFLDIVFLPGECEKLLQLIEKSIYRFGIEHLEMSEIVSLKSICDELTTKVYPQEKYSPVHIEGYLDRYDGENLFGWCINKELKEAATVHIYFKDKSLPHYKILSDKFRGDLKSAGKRDGCSAFSLPLNIYMPILVNSTRVYAVEHHTKEHLNNSGMLLQPQFIHFNVERIVDGVIYGWVYDRNHPKNYIDISAFSIKNNNVTVSRFERADMESRGINSRAGFSIHSKSFSDAPDFIEVFLKNSNHRISRAIMV